MILDSDGAGSGALWNTKVQAAIRMLGANFFQDMTGARRGRGKTYDQSTLVAESQDVDDSTTLNANSEEYIVDEDHFEALFQDSLHEGDEDAALIQDFEAAATDLIQSDEDLAMAYNAYSDARRRLTEKFRSRGFWPISSGKSKGRGSFKGSSKGKFGKSHSSSRKSLQQRIMESKCRICGKVGHWKAECPSRTDGTSSASSRTSQAPTSFVQPSVHEATDDHIDALPLEFLSLPETASTIDEAFPNLFVANVFVGVDNQGDNGKSRLRETLQRWEDCQSSFASSPRNEVREDSPKIRLMQRILKSKTGIQEQCKPEGSTEAALFASHSSFGVVDLGATKTVIGSNNVVDLMNNLHPKVREQVERCQCRITFRFGNQGTLQSQHALVIPFSGFRLKIAVVPGDTPFLLSNTLLRAIGAVIDTDQSRMWSSKLQRDIPLHLTQKGLFLMDLNDLVTPAEVSPKSQFTDPTETHVSVEEKNQDTSSDSPSVILSRQHEIEKDNHITTVSHDQSNIESSKEVVQTATITRVERPCQPEHQNQSSASSSGSKVFARSFRYPKSQHGLESTPEEPAGQGQRDSSRPFSPSVGGPPPGEDSVWSEAFWQKLPDGVEHRSDLGHLGDPTLRFLNQGGSSQVHAIRGTSDREGRKVGREDRCEGGTTGSHYQGSWEVLPSSGKDSSGQDPSRSFRGRRGGHLRDDRPAPGSSGARRSTPGSSHAQSGECASTRDQPFGRSSSEGSEQFECPIDAVFQALQEAGDVSSDCHLALAPEVCKERRRFQDLVSRYQSELDSLLSTIDGSSSKKKVDLLEVFCSPQSMLTHQCQQMAYRAIRFSPEQGNLQSQEGRQLLFNHFFDFDPKNVWFSPTCGPWSGWSNLNGSKSLQPGTTFNPCG